MNRSRVILLVEDNEDDVERTRLTFRRSNVVNDIVVARDGQEALEYLFATGRHADRDPDRSPEVVLLDLNLPKIDGLGVLKEVRANQRTRRLPVVVLTSSTAERDLVRSHDPGAHSFLQKPVDFTEFIDAARQLGLYWLVINQAPPPVAHEVNDAG